MEPRINLQQAESETLKGMFKLANYAEKSELGDLLCELVRLRASQINGCAYCIDMHTKDAREAGEAEQRLYALNAWRETPFYSERERAALAWTEALTQISENEVSDELYDSVCEHFEEEELISLTIQIVAINGWDRLAIPFRGVPGSYKPEMNP